MNELVRRVLRLTLADGVGSITFLNLCEHFGSLEAAAEAAGKPAWLRQVKGIGDKIAGAIAAVTEEDVEREIALAEKAGANIICPDDAEYPAALRYIPDPPPLLYVLGSLVKADAVAMGVVGARRCTHYGLEQAERFGGLLGRAGFTVVSGGARGIDTAAHRGSLEASGRTIAVMGCGLGDLYPPENRPFFRQIVESGRGAVISELPMLTAVLAGNFPTRNRIISGLSLGLLVVEAARRSGSLITARSAIEQGKEVFALPGRVDSPFSQGTNDLIRQGSAHLVQSLEEMLEDLDKVGEQLQASGAVQAAEKPRVMPELDELERKLVALMGVSELALDDLVTRSGLETPKVTAALTMLAIKGVVRQRPGGRFAVRGPEPTA